MYFAIKYVTPLSIHIVPRYMTTTYPKCVVYTQQQCIDKSTDNDKLRISAHTSVQANIIQLYFENQ